MILKQIDFLSPKITLYHKGFLSYSSIFSGILSIISIIIIIFFAVYYSLDLIKKENPKATIYSSLEEDAGIVPINSSSLFHFIELVDSKKLSQKFDFESFTIVGLDIYYLYYLQDKNLEKYDHWLYGLCNNETDTKGISHLIYNNNFENSACIRKYYNSTEKKYYNTDDEKFRWPTLEHGIYNPNVKGYNLVLEKCDDRNLKIIFGEERKCKKDIEIEELFTKLWGVHFHFIEQSVDVLDYKEPNKKKLTYIENSLLKDKYAVNHIHLNPCNIKTDDGLILNVYKEESSYNYERNDEYIYDNNGNDAYVAYNFWMKNKMQRYERVYKKIQDVISDIGGISQFITIVVSFINLLYNKYLVLIDNEELLNPYINIKENENNINIIKNINGTLKNQNNLLIIESKDKNNSKNNDMTEKHKVLMENNINQLNDKKEKITDNSQKIKNKLNNNTKTSFWNFLCYKLCCREKNSKYKLYEDFRIKVISDEQMIKNFFNIYDLLKTSKTDENQYKYLLKDLINEG